MTLHLTGCTSESAPIDSKTVKVNGSHWPKGHLWDGFDWSRAELRSGSIWSNDDYHLGVPWMHPRDIATFGRRADMEGIYRLKRGWHSFVKVDGQWMVSKAPRIDNPPFGTPPESQVRVIDVVLP